MKVIEFLLPAIGPWFSLKFGGGSSNSSAATSNTTNQTDMRATGGDNATVISAQDSTINVTPTDFGAVLAGADVARQAIKANTDILSTSLNSNAATLTKTVASLNDAYETAKAGDQKIVSMVGMAVVGLAAAFAFAAKKG